MSRPGLSYEPLLSSWNVASVVADICARRGIDYNRLNLDRIEGALEGFSIQGGEAAFSAIELLASAFLFDAANFDGILNFIPRGEPVIAAITSDDLLDDSEGIEQVNRLDPIIIPRVINMSYYDTEGGLTPDKQTSDRTLDNRSKGEKSSETTIIMRADDAARLVVISHKVMIEEQRGDVRFKLPDSFSWLTVSDCITLDGVRLRIDECEIDEGFQSYVCRFDRPSAYESDIKGNPASIPSEPPSLIVANTRFEFIDSHILSDQDDTLGYYVAATPLDTNWTGSVVELSRDGGQNWIDSGNIESPAVIGDLSAELLAAPVWYPDANNTLRVTLLRDDMELISATFAEQLNRANLAIVGNELISFGEATQVGPTEWELSYLLRGRKGSEIPASHPIGTRFVLLNSRVSFVPTQLFELGRSLSFRASTFGADVPGEVVTVVFTGQSQVERQPAYLQALKIAGTIRISWQGVGRLGGGSSVGMGAQFDGYRVTVNGAPQTTSAMSVTVTDPGGAVTISVQQINRITGLGPALTAVI